MGSTKPVLFGREFRCQVEVIGKNGSAFVDVPLKKGATISEIEKMLELKGFLDLIHGVEVELDKEPK